MSVRTDLEVEFENRLLGLLLVGSRARGDAHSQSDLDLEAITEDRRVIERRFDRDGYRVELLVRPRRVIEDSLHVDPYVVERLAEGIFVGPVAPELLVTRRLAEAARPLQRPRPSALDCFISSRRVTRALDRAARTSDVLSRVSNRSEALSEALKLRFWLAGRYAPRGRKMIEALQTVDEVAANSVQNFCRCITEKDAPGDFFDRVLDLAGCADEGDYSFFYDR